MESYCVIQFKNRKEKVLVSNLLATNTDVDFKITTDLKKNQEKEIEEIQTGVADQDVVVIPPTINIVTEQAPSPSLSNVVQPMPGVGNKEKEVKKEVVVDMADVEVSSDCVIIDHPAEDVSMDPPPTINTLQNEQHSTQSFSVSDPIIADQPIPDINNTKNLMSMDDYGTYGPYLERPVEPNEENVDDIAIVVDNGNHQDITDMHEPTIDTNQSVPIVADQPTPVIDNTQNLMGIDEYGNYVPYLERPVELKEESDMTIQTGINKSAEIGDIVGVASPTTDTLQDRQHSTQSFSIPDPMVFDQPIPDIDNSQNLMDINDYGTPFEPNEENVDNTSEVGDKENLLEDVGEEEFGEDMIGNASDVGLIANDEDDNISIDGVLMQNQVDTPSSSTIRRSVRVTKKPRYSMDEDSDVEQTPSTKCSKKTDQSKKKSTRHGPKRSKCKKCGTKVKTHYCTRMEHVIDHTDIIRFECLVDRCGMKHRTRSLIRQHMTRKHNSQLNAFASTELTKDQKAELDSVLRECFHDSEKDIGDNCQVCNQNVGGKCRNSFGFKRDHAFHHVDFMLYKCMEDGCQFEGNSMRSMKNHGYSLHKTRTSPKFSKIDLTAEQKLEIEETLVKCFPNMENDGNES